MKPRYAIKADAKELIKNNNVWITIGLIPTILSVLVLTNQFSNNTNLTLLTTPLSILLSFFEVGVMLYVYDVINGRKEIQPGFTNQLKDIINSITTKSFVVYLLVSLYTILWVLIPIVGFIIAIIKGYAYNLSIYIAKDNEQLGYNEIITNSRVRMDGNKLDRFMLTLSFIPWLLLSLVTMGLANIYVTPYMLTADAIFANEVLEEKKGY